MPTLHIPTEQLFDMVAQLPPDELGRFSARLAPLIRLSKAKRLSFKEAKLLAEINTPFAQQARYRALFLKREAEELTETEHQELLVLCEEAELFNAKRLEALVLLANLREVSLPELMNTLDINPL